MGQQLLKDRNASREVTSPQLFERAQVVFQHPLVVQAGLDAGVNAIVDAPGGAVSVGHALAAEIAPIDDVRGSAAYKRELARRLLFAHVLRAAPDRVALEELV